MPGHGVEIHRAALVGYILQESKRMVRGLSEGKCPGRRQKRQFNANMVVQRSNQSVRKQQRMPEACHVMVSAAHSACSVSGSAHDAMVAPPLLSSELLLSVSRTHLVLRLLGG